MGRPKKPTNMKIVHGTFRKDRANPDEPKPAVSVPDAPAHLSDHAREEWDRITPVLESMGLVSHIDRTALACYCQSWGDHVAAELMLREQGPVVTTTNGNIVQSPLVGISNTAKQLAHKFLVEFGLTPASRAKVSASPQEKKADPKQRFFA